MILCLGVVYKNGKVINHRSLVKVFVNPFLRIFGLQVVTNVVNNELRFPDLMKCERKRKLELYLKYNRDFDFVEKKRRLI